jgi:hypothetical protein
LKEHNVNPDKPMHWSDTMVNIVRAVTLITLTAVSVFTVVKYSRTVNKHRLHSVG